MRSKEEAHDYRYFPEPDLGLLAVDEAWLAEAASAMPELPRARRARFVSRYAVAAQDAETLVGSRELADYFERTAQSVNAKLAANWVTGEVLRGMKERRVSIEEALSFPVSPERLAALLKLVESGAVSTASAKEVLAAMMDSPEAPEAIVERKGLSSLRDSGAVDSAIAEVLAANPSQLALYRSGKTQTYGWFFGQVMKRTGGRADPAAVKEALTKALGPAPA
jgi:aspartyl-tRNA(Asn)/glutamyl-tRNA(Gln) amidotransferase subunit B